MAEPLAPLSPLDGYAAEFNGARLAEVTGLAIVSLAVSRGMEATLAARLKKTYRLALPAPGGSAVSGERRLIWMAPDQFLLIFPQVGSDPVGEVRKAIGDGAWLTDQSDSYCLLRCEGPGVRKALERICPLDLDPRHFARDAAARTMMEHLGVLIVREAEDGFLLASARSSAHSFLHAVKLSFENTQ